MSPAIVRVSHSTRSCRKFASMLVCLFVELLDLLN